MQVVYLCIKNAGTSLKTSGYLRQSVGAVVPWEVGRGKWHALRDVVEEHTPQFPLAFILIIEIQCCVDQREACEAPLEHVPK